MRPWLFTFLLFTNLLSAAEIPNESASVLISQAIELLKDGKNKEALPLLEKAFSQTQNAIQLKEAAVLILRATPPSFSRRHTYLHYLIKFHSDHADYPFWLMEIGDRELAGGKITEAKKTYLKALENSEEEPQIQFRVGKIYWKEKKLSKAFQYYLGAYAGASKALKKELRPQMSKLWWEIGVLSKENLKELKLLNRENRGELILDFAKNIPLQQSPQQKMIDPLLQLKNETETESFIHMFLATGPYFPKAPCFLLGTLITAEDPVSSEALLKCMESPQRPGAEELLPYFSRLMNRSSEKVDLAQAKLLAELSRKQEAALLLLNSPLFQENPASYKESSLKYIQALDEKNFHELYSLAQKSSFEILVSLSKNKELLRKLQKEDPHHWIPFEEKLYEGKPKPKSFILKKSAWLSSNKENSEAELEKLFEEILRSSELTKEELELVNHYQMLKNRAETKLPATFSPNFKNAYEAWLKDIERSLNALKGFSKDWQSLAKPAFEKEAKLNAKNLILQLDQLKASDKLENFIEEFEQKRNEWKAEVRTLLRK